MHINHNSSKIDQIWWVLSD